MSTEVLKRCLCSHHLEPWSPANNARRLPLAAASLKLSVNEKGVGGRSRGCESLPKNKNQRECDRTSHSPTSEITLEIGKESFYKSGRPARKESVLVLGPHTLRLPPREVPGGSSDTCRGRDLDLIDTEHLRPRGPGDAGEMEGSVAPSLSKAERIHVQVHKLHTRPRDAVLLRGDHLGCIFILSYFVDIF